MNWLKLVPQLVLVALLAYGLVVAGMYVFQRRFQYHPGPPPGPPGQYGLDGAEEVGFATADGLRLTGWYLPPTTPDGRVVLYFHGNAGTLDWLVAKAQTYRAAGFGVLLFDWRGFGASAGSPTEEGLYADGRAAIAFLESRGVPRSRLIFHGESLGSGVATLMAAEGAPAAVILEAPFTSTVDVGALVYPWLPVRWLMKDRYPSIERIAKNTAPLLILHGERDGLVPVAHGRALLAAATSSKTGWFAPEGHHADLWEHGADRAVIDWLATALP